LLGSMLTTRIYLAAMSRADLPVAEMRVMPNFYFYVDEFQSFANATFANILSEARKYHLNLIIAHQYIEQMEEDVRNAVFGNVGTTIAFRVGPFDAEVLETVFAPRFEATDLVNLGFAQIYLTLMIEGIGSQPFSATTMAPVELPDNSCRELVVESSRKSYTKDRVGVEKIVADLHTPVVEEKPKKSFDKRQNNNQGKQFPPRSKNSNAENPRGGSVPGQSTTFKKQVTNEKTPGDLRQILSKMKPQASKSQNSDNSVGVKVEGVSDTRKRSPTERSTGDNKSALADVLKKAGVNYQTTHKPVLENQKPKPMISNKQTIQKPPIEKSAVRKVVIEHRKNPVTQTNNSSPRKSDSQNSNENQLNAGEIKRMLRNSESERSPFN
ncbi:MAG: type IV secretory system conjugative DNA transfer family protein, partial [Candidatus Pacebacteria bacterium]|nr:type IV secretory system conjugative DNA transfer family protein [Candidatus Paceibacterota bacterium]